MNPGAGEYNPYRQQPQGGYNASYDRHQEECPDGFATGGFQQQEGMPPSLVGDPHSDPTQPFQDFSELYGYQESELYLQYGQNQDASAPASVEYGYYDALGSLQPTLYGSPVSALCYSDSHHALHVASLTQTFGKTGRFSHHKASMLVAHSTLDGMLYSSCAAHPEATISTLKAVYTTFYGGQRVESTHRPIPSRAIEPCYSYTLSASEPKDLASFTPNTSHWGISEILATNGYLVTVSPGAVRVHTQGGLCVSDYEIEGMICATPHPHVGDAVTHISVGGISTGAQNKAQVHCMDLYQNLRIVSSQALTTSMDKDTLGVMCTASNHSNNTVLAGCSDGTIRFLDGSGRIKRGQVANVKSHNGGVNSISVSEDGVLIATTGFSSRSNIYNLPHCLPDQHLLVYDARYLGRGGIIHSFSGTRGSPRFVEFMPDMEGMPRNRIIAASSQIRGGLQVLEPFGSVTNVSSSSFMIPPLELEERMTGMCVSDEYLAVGTSKSNVFQYQLSGYERTKMRHDQPEERQLLDFPNYVPPIPALSIDPVVLMNQPNGLRNGPTDRIKSIFGAYTMCTNPVVTPLGNPNEPSTFGPLADAPMIGGCKRVVSSTLIREALQNDGDIVQTIPTSALHLDLLEDQSSLELQGHKKEKLPNPNKLLYTEKLARICFQADVRWGENRTKGEDKDSLENTTASECASIPARYKATLRPHYVSIRFFEHGPYNKTGIWPGWDYPSTMPSSYAPSVLMLTYFVPEIRSAMLAAQSDNFRVSNYVDKMSLLSTELGFLYHHIESISKSATIYPNGDTSPYVDAFVPINFLSAFTTMPEADALALLDNNPAAVDRAQRAEAFYRFLLHQLDKEARWRKTNGSKLMDSLHGLNFVSINQFIDVAGEPTFQSNRALTVGLDYDRFIQTKNSTTQHTYRFGQVLQHALCRESRIRAWCQSTKSFKTIVQRKLATSLPEILSLSCACAGRKEEDGMFLWRGHGINNGHWLPEFVEVEIQDDGNVVVRELIDLDDGKKEWTEFHGDLKLPKEISDLLTKDKDIFSPKKYQYRLEAVLSFIRDDMDPKIVGEGVDGHHVLHVRVPQTYKKRCLTRQRDNAEQLVKSLQKVAENQICAEKLTMTGSLDPALVKKRAEIAKDRISAGDKERSEDWVLFNGFVVNPTFVDDARGFNVEFKEPCLVVFRAMGTPPVKFDEKPSPLPVSVMQTRSLKPLKFSVKNSIGMLETCKVCLARQSEHLTKLFFAHQTSRGKES